MKKANSYISKRIKSRNSANLLMRDLLRRYDYKCAICGWSLPVETPDGKIQRQGGCDFHHIIPHRDGGQETEDNLILLCPNCHKKADCGLITRDDLQLHILYKESNDSPIAWLNGKIEQFKQKKNNSMRI